MYFCATLYRGHIYKLAPISQRLILICILFACLGMVHSYCQSFPFIGLNSNNCGDEDPIIY